MEVESGKYPHVTATIDAICKVMSQERVKTSLQCPWGGQRLGIVVIRNDCCHS